MSVGTENMRASMENSGAHPVQVKDGAVSNTPKKKRSGAVVTNVRTPLKKATAWGTDVTIS